MPILPSRHLTQNDTCISLGISNERMCNNCKTISRWNDYPTSNKGAHQLYKKNCERLWCKVVIKFTKASTIHKSLRW